MAVKEKPHFERIRAARKFASAVADRRFHEEKVAAMSATPEMIDQDAFDLLVAQRKEQEAREAYREALPPASGARVRTKLKT